MNPRDEVGLYGAYGSTEWIFVPFINRLTSVWMFEKIYFVKKEVTNQSDANKVILYGYAHFL